jgi:hypothetical protein
MTEIEEEAVIKSTLRTSPIIWTLICFVLLCGIGFYLDDATFDFALISVVFIGLGFSCLLWFFTLKTVTITNQSFIVSWVLLSKKEEFHFDEIVRVSHDKLKYDTTVTSDFVAQTYTIHEGRQLLIYLKPDNKIITWTTYTFGNYDDLVRSLKQARKVYKANIRREKSNISG